MADIETPASKVLVIYLLIVWLHRVLVVARWIFFAIRGIFVVVCGLSSCGDYSNLVAPCIWHLSSPTRDQTCVPCIRRQILNHWITRELPKVFFFSCLKSLGIESKNSREGSPWPGLDYRVFPVPLARISGGMSTYQKGSGIKQGQGEEHLEGRWCWECPLVSMWSKS